MLTHLQCTKTAPKTNLQHKHTHMHGLPDTLFREYVGNIILMYSAHLLENIGAARPKSTRKQYQTLLSPRVMFWWYSVLLVVLHIKHVFQNTICLKSFGHLSLITIERPYFIYMINVVFVCRCIKCTTLFQKWGPITMLLRKLLIPSFILSSVRRISLKLYN